MHFKIFYISWFYSEYSINKFDVRPNLDDSNGIEILSYCVHEFLTIVRQTAITSPNDFNLLATDFFFQILAHPVFKM